MKISFSPSISTLREYAPTNPYQALKDLINKVVNLVYPENELTKCRSFKFIPSFVINALGYVTYCSECPSYKTLKADSCPDLVNDVNEVFNKLLISATERCPSISHMSWEISIKKDNAINAFCCPGGKVIITTGILQMLESKQTNDIQQKDLIAAVLGHEITHAIAEHGSKTMHFFIFSKLIIRCFSYALSVLFIHKPKTDENLKENGKKKTEEEANKNPIKNGNCLSKGIEIIFSFISFLLHKGYSQSNELEADRFGIEIAKKAGYNIDASISLQEMFLEMKGQTKDQKQGVIEKAQKLMSSHPPSQERLQKNQETINRLRSLD